MIRLTTTARVAGKLGEMSDRERAMCDDIVQGCSESITEYCGRLFEADGESGSSRTYSGGGTRSLWIDDLLELTSVTIDGIAESNVVLEPANRLPKTQLLRQYGASWPVGIQNVVVTGRFGYAETVPGPVREACTLLVIASLRPGGRRLDEETLGVKSVSVDGFSTTWETVTLSDVSTWPADVTRALAPYRKVSVFAI